MILYLLTSTSGDCYYSLLGIKKSSSLKEIKAAYRKKAKETHPDKNPNADSEEASKKFREVIPLFVFTLCNLLCCVLLFLLLSEEQSVE